MSIKKIKGLNKYYIHSDGYFFKIYGGKEIIIPIKMIKSIPKVNIGNENKNAIWLLLEYFGEKHYAYHEFHTQRFKFKMDDKGRIPFSSIKLIENKSNQVSDNRIIKFKCDLKAISANSRVNQLSTISKEDVYFSLERVGFKCTYCNRNLNPETWELDHVQPLSRGGLNVSTNITASCKSCNRMKGGLEMPEFINRVMMISKNYSDTYLVEENKIQENG